MRLGDLLIRAKRVTEEDVQRALKLGREEGGRLGDNLVAIGAIDAQALQNFLRRIPAEPQNIAATKIDETELIGLLMKCGRKSAMKSRMCITSSARIFGRQL